MWRTGWLEGRKGRLGSASRRSSTMLSSPAIPGEIPWYTCFDVGPRAALGGNSNVCCVPLCRCHQPAAVLGVPIPKSRAGRQGAYRLTGCQAGLYRWHYCRRTRSWSAAEIQP